MERSEGREGRVGLEPERCAREVDRASSIVTPLAPDASAGKTEHHESNPNPS